MKKEMKKKRCCGADIAIGVGRVGGVGGVGGVGDRLSGYRDMLQLAEFKVIGFLGFIDACEPNVNAPCNLTLRAQLKEKEEVYVVSQMEDGSINESTSDDLKALWRRIDFIMLNVEGREGLILLTLSTRDGKKKTYAVKDANVLNEKGIEFILGPGPKPNDVPLSNIVEEMEIIVWFSGRPGYAAQAYDNSRLELLFGGLSRYNAGEDSLEVRWSDIVGASATLLAESIKDGELDLVALSGIDSKGKKVRMMRKVSGYRVEKGKMTLELSSKGLKAKRGDIVAAAALREFKSGNYGDVALEAFDPMPQLYAVSNKRYSYRMPSFNGILRKGKDGKVRVAFKAGKENVLRYDRETGLISSMDVERFIGLQSERELLIQREPDDKEPCVYPYARCSKCGECDIQAKLIGLKKVSEDTWVGGVEFMGEFMGDIVNIAGSGEVVRMRLL